MDVIIRANQEKRRVADGLGDITMGAILKLKRRMCAQAAIAQAVEGRGYREDWTAAQFLVRQVAKLQEELGELAKAVSAPVQIATRRCVRPPWLKMIGVAAFSSRTEFDNRADAWELARVDDLEAVKKELADLQVVLFCAAGVVGELEGEEFDVVEAALEKALGDVERGVRGQGDKGAR